MTRATDSSPGPPAARAATLLGAGALAWALGVTVLRAARHPNDFADAHWLLDYRFGFIRRGLAGEVLALLSKLGPDLRTEDGIATIAYVVFALCGATLLAVGIRIVSRLAWDRNVALVVLVFLTSPFIVTSAHLMGYLDQIVFVLAFAAVWCALRGHPWVAASAVALGVFVHENALLVALPPLALVIAAPWDPERGGRRAWRRLAPLLLPVVAFGALALIETAVTDRAVLRSLLQIKLERYRFVQGDMHIFVPEWLTTSVAENAAAQSHRFFERLTAGSIVLAVLPAVQVALFGAYVRLDPAKRRIVGPALVAVAFAPLILHLSAWDTARLWSYTIVGAFLGFWIVVERSRAAPLDAAVLTPVVALPALLANVAGRIPLLDGVTERFSSPALLELYAPAALAFVGFWLLRSRPGGGARE